MHMLVVGAIPEHPNFEIEIRSASHPRGTHRVTQCHKRDIFVTVLHSMHSPVRCPVVVALAHPIVISIHRNVSIQGKEFQCWGDTYNGSKHRCVFKSSSFGGVLSPCYKYV